jgi:serine/threonine protein phosphatase 1
VTEQMTGRLMAQITQPKAEQVAPSIAGAATGPTGNAPASDSVLRPADAPGVAARAGDFLRRLLRTRRAPDRTGAAYTPRGMRIYAIGDIHGRADLLEGLLTRIDAEAGSTRAKLVFLGDYVDRGPDSRSTIDRLLALDPARYDLTFLRGNHEALLLAFLERAETGYAWIQIGGGETLASYGVTPPARSAPPEDYRLVARAFAVALPAAHLAFLRATTLRAQLGDYVFVHAGLRPGLDLERQIETDMLGIRDRFLSDKGRWPFVVVHGHSPSERVFQDARRIGVDTGAYATGRLSAVRLDGASVSFLST